MEAGGRATQEQLPRTRSFIDPMLRYSSLYTNISKHVIPAGIAGNHDCKDAGGRATQEQFAESTWM
ncbi:MAG TPA: hypothetical protein VIF37_04140 [Methylobacter sp.]|jgi:hypothetical protein